jgi:hypothetical protein
MESDKKRKLLLVSGGVIAAGLILVVTKGPSPSVATSNTQSTLVVEESTPVPTAATFVPTASASRVPYAEEGPLQTYAIAAAELRGLPPDAAPGTLLRIWVAWDPPITEAPEFRILLDSVVLEKLIPPIAPEGPVTALLSASPKRIADLLYGDRYGALSVTVLDG